MNRSGFGQPSHNMSSLNQSLAEAVDLFVMTKFDQCYNVCNSVIKIAKCEPEEERYCEVIEAATALGIQALAETDKWYQVVAFITDVYGSVELCPPRIVQVCILLHAHVREYLPCHKLVQMWLKSPHNLNHKQCCQVIRIYAHHILCPTGSYETLKEVVHSCKSLTETERSALLRLPQAELYEDAKRQSSEPHFYTSESVSHRHRSGVENVHSDLKPGQDSDVSSSSVGQDGDVNSTSRVCSSSNDTSEKKPAGLTTLQAVINKLGRVIALGLSCLRKQGFGLVIMGVIAVYALFHTQTGDPVSSLGRLVILWRVFLQRLGLFSSSV